MLLVALKSLVVMFLGYVLSLQQIQRACITVAPQDPLGHFPSAIITRHVTNAPLQVPPLQHKEYKILISPILPTGKEIGLALPLLDD